jgi:hypothetical protein
MIMDTEAPGSDVTDLREIRETQEADGVFNENTQLLQVPSPLLIPARNTLPSRKQTNESWNTGDEDNARSVANRSADPMVRSAHQELESLNALLNEQETRMRRAQRIAANLHRQFQLADADNSRIRSELHSARDELAAAVQAHNVEIGLAAQRASNLSDELVETRYRAVTAVESAARQRRIWLGICAAAVAVAVFWVVILYWQLRQIRIQSGPEGKTVASVTKTTAPVLPDLNSAHEASQPPPAAQAGGLGRGNTRDFSGALARLDRALGLFRGNNPEDVLRHIRKVNAASGISVCSFEWNDGQPSLLFGKTGDELDLETALDHCAEAVEKAAQ